jgi:hypothetical protein
LGRGSDAAVAFAQAARTTEAASWSCQSTTDACSVKCGRVGSADAWRTTNGCGAVACGRTDSKSEEAEIELKGSALSAPGFWDTTARVSPKKRN